jgi:hypothetical protein
VSGNYPEIEGTDMSEEAETEQQPSLSMPILGTHIIQAPTDEKLGVALIFLDGGDVRWVAVRQADADEATE